MNHGTALLLHQRDPALLQHQKDRALLQRRQENQERAARITRTHIRPVALTSFLHFSQNSKRKGRRYTLRLGLKMYLWFVSSIQVQMIVFLL
ncbi:hypothetical protein NC651_006041 [Populus alba x Populus x berolinensis]|nr:hypothetical protein NC651_006041 [Populus alba x Populus x berolinensis]